MWNATGTTSWTPPAGVTSVEYLVVAGGGAGGSYGGGGGAGGFRLDTLTGLSGSQTVIVGDGGQNYSADGSNSTFGSVTSVGGGGGGTYPSNGRPGGSGSGGSFGGYTGGDADYLSPRQGYDGGTGYTPIVSYARAGGGGGAGEVGENGGVDTGGIGGDGKENTLTQDGELSGGKYYLSGGGGGYPDRVSARIAGGLGGGGDGDRALIIDNDGLANTGGGGGGSETTPGKGGSGIVIIKYLTPIGIPPIPSFTSNVVSGYAPQAVQFNDTSITTPTAWNWSYTNVTPGNNTQIWWSQIQNATNTFGVGNWDIRLNVTNATGFATTTSPYYVNISPPMVLANFTCSPLALTTSDTLSCVDTSTSGGATITNWAWTFEDAPPQSATTQNAAITYTSDGVWDVTHGVYNATTGWNNLTKNNYVTVSASGAFSGFNRQDIMMDGIYTLTLNVKDSVTLGGIPGAVVATSNGDNTTTSVLGVATISTNYTALVVQVGASGYLSRAISYVVDRDRTETIYLTPITIVPTTVPNTNILYTPKQIEVVVVSYNPAGVVVNNASVTLEAVDNSLQADAQLETLYGINPIAANQLMNGTLIMHGLTDSGGGVVFTVLQSINYKATIVDPRDGKSYIAMLYPGMDPYTIWIGTSPLAVNVTANTYLNTTKIFVTQPNVGNITMNMQYQNKLGTTTSVVFTVKHQNNLTTAYQTTIAGFGTSMVYANYTVPNVRGQGYFYGYNASRNI
jgi:PKD repeat protein